MYNYEEALMFDIPIDTSEAQKRLSHYLQVNTPLLQSIIRSYVMRMGLAHGNAIEMVAAEVLHDTVLEALRHAERVDLSTQPRAWLLAIAANIIKRKRASTAKLHQYEISISDLPLNTNMSSESDIFDQLNKLTQPGPEQDSEANEQAIEILSLVSPQDQKLLHLAVLHDLDINTMAQILEVSTGTARVRFHRALQRLRTAWQKREQNREVR